MNTLLDRAKEGEERRLVSVIVESKDSGTPKKPMLELGHGEDAENKGFVGVDVVERVRLATREGSSGRSEADATRVFDAT